MGIADFFRPKHRHSDVRVRTEAVRALTADDAAILVQVAKTDRDSGVRRIAIEKIDEADVLAEIAASESERSLRDFAGERAARLWTSAACGDDPDEATSALAGILKLGDQRALIDIVVRAAVAAVKKRAFGELRDPRALAELAKSEAPQDLRTAAIARIDDGDVLRALAIDTTQKEVGLAAVEKIDDRDRLENVAQKAKNKAVRQKARKIVAEIEEAERQKKPGVPDDVKRRRAEKAQLVREVEAVADSFDFAKVEGVVKAAEAAWAALGGADDGDDRFAKVVERFWKRKAVHDEQSRSADELRAVEREAQYEKERAAQERAAAKPSEDRKREREPDDYVRELVPDDKRAAREAESKARREERAEEDERRKAQAADREARQKEDAERGAAIGASLRALCDDMEQLAASLDGPPKGAGGADAGKRGDLADASAVGGAGAIGDDPRTGRPTDSAGIIVRRASLRSAGGTDAGKRGDVADASAAEGAGGARIDAGDAGVRADAGASGEVRTQHASREMRAQGDGDRREGEGGERRERRRRDGRDERRGPDIQGRMREIDRLLSQAQKAFEQIGKVGASERDAIADRYRAVRGKLVMRAGEMREAEDWQRWTNVPKAEALIATAKEMLEAPATPDLGNRLRGLQALWKEVGPMPQRRSKELWDQFKGLCDQVYEKVKGVRAVENDRFAEVTKVKEALIAEAEALADSTDWAATAEKLKALQGSWKQSGHLPRKQGDELWKRFRGACDRFFERRKPVLDAQHVEEAENLRRKQALIARAQTVADRAPDDGGWGKAIGTIKDLQREWKEIGFVPRRDADAVYRAFRAACDALFAKRDAARDGEANAHRADLDAARAEIDAVIAAGEGADGADVIARALAARAKAAELGSLSAEVERMLAHVTRTFRGSLAGTELDPARTHAARSRLITRAEELLPKQAPGQGAGGDVASQLKAAMRGNAFSGLRFSGRDPIEVVDELRASWREVGPVDPSDAKDVALADQFDEVLDRVLAAAGVSRGDRGDSSADADRSDRERGEGRRRRRERHSGQQATPSADSVDASSARSSTATADARSSSDAHAPASARSTATVDARSSGQAHATSPLPAAVHTPASDRSSSEAHVASAVAHASSDAVARRDVSESPSASAPVADVHMADTKPYAGTPPAAVLETRAARPTAVHSSETQPYAGVPPAAAVAVAATEAVSGPREARAQTGLGVPLATHDAVTEPSRVPGDVPINVAIPVEPPPVPAPRKASSTLPPPPMDALDTGWDLGDEDPTATPDEPISAAPPAEDKPSTPSSSEMAGDGAVEGDGIDTGWD